MNDAGCVAEQLLVECRHGRGEPSVAYRGPHRWVQTFEKVRLHTPDAEKQCLRENGTYLITGGLGALGLHFAELLARTIQARLILLGRSDFPARDEWQAWLQAHTDSDTTSEIIRRLQRIEDVGGEVLIVKADVTQRENLHAAIECGRIRFGKIHGVIHAAGIAGGGMMQRRTAEECATVLAPKIDGTRYLRDLFRHDPPEVFVLCSSIEAIRGSFGQADYCAANCFLDAFAYASTYRDGFPMVSINWDMWRDTGMASAKAALKSKRLGGDLHPLLGRPLPASPGEHVFEAVFRPEDQWVLNEHRIFDGTGVVPGTAFLEMARSAFSTLHEKQAVEFSDVMFIQPLAVPDGHKCEIRTTMVQDDSGFSFEVRSREAANNSGWRNHAVGRLAVAESQTARHQTRKVEAMITELQLSEVSITAAQKEQIGRHGFGPRWDTVERVFLGATNAVALIALPAAFAGDLTSFVLHPALLDTAVGYANLHLGGGEMFLPLSYGKIRAHAALPARFYSHVHFDKDFAASTDTIRYDVTLMDPDGVELVRIDELVFRRVDASSFPTQRKSERLPEDTAAAARPMSGGMRPEDGVEAVRRIIARPLGPQVIVSLKDPAKVIEEAGRVQEVEIIEKLGLLARPGGSARMSRPSLSSDYAPPLEGVESQLASSWGELLGVEPVGRNDNFFELGGDSVVAIQMIAKAHHVGVNVTPQHVFRYPSIAELAAVIGGDAGRSRIGIDAADSTRAFALLDLDDEAINMLAQEVEEVDAGQRRGP
jgi:NAD(P)-dependent dehydrogenase (short-subunit alcohol dehydrogenase family)